MVSCKDCIHENICKHFAQPETINFDSFIELFQEDVECDKCKYFKDRSKFINLRCDLNDKLYAVNAKGEIKSWKIIYIRAIKSSFNWNPDHIELTIGCDKGNRKGTMWIHCNKTNSFYFTPEEAEKALKEREKE